MLYRLPSCPLDVRELAERLDPDAAADVVLFREGADAVARRDGEELRFRLAVGEWELDGDTDVLDPSEYPNGLERSWRALACPNAGDVIVSAAPGFEFVDVGGRAHVGGGSHGSLRAGDSTVPVLAAGFDVNPLPPELELVDLAPLVADHFGLEPFASTAERRERTRV